MKKVVNLKIRLVVLTYLGTKWSGQVCQVRPKVRRTSRAFLPQDSFSNTLSGKDSLSYRPQEKAQSLRRVLIEGRKDEVVGLRAARSIGRGRARAQVSVHHESGEACHKALGKHVQVLSKPLHQTEGQHLLCAGPEATSLGQLPPLSKMLFLGALLAFWSLLWDSNESFLYVICVENGGSCHLSFRQNGFRAQGQSDRFLKQAGFKRSSFLRFLSNVKTKKGFDSDEAKKFSTKLFSRKKITNCVSTIIAECWELFDLLGTMIGAFSVTKKSFKGDNL